MNPPTFRVQLINGPRDGETILVPNPGIRRIDVAAHVAAMDPAAIADGSATVLYVVEGDYEQLDDNPDIYEARAVLET